MLHRWMKQQKLQQKKKRHNGNFLITKLLRTFLKFRGWKKEKRKKKESELKLILTCQISWSECSSRGSRLFLMVPSNKVGSWGMILRRLRRSWRPIFEISMLSIMILPPSGSVNRNKAWIKVDLPLPVRPTIPIFFPPGNLQVTSWRTTGRFSL